MVCIERCGPGDYKVVTPQGTTTGPTLEEALVTALVKAGVGDEEFIHTLAGSFLWAEALSTLMEGQQEPRFGSMPLFDYPTDEEVALT